MKKKKVPKIKMSRKSVSAKNKFVKTLVYALYEFEEDMGGSSIGDEVSEAVFEILNKYFKPLN